MGSVPPLLAHQGGWDEILLVAGPILLIVGLLAVVKRRVDADLPGAAPDEPTTTDHEVDDGERSGG